MNKFTPQLLFLLFALCSCSSNAYLQTYNYTYIQNSNDTLIVIDTVNNKEVFSMPWTMYVEQNYVKSGRYGAICFENATTSLGTGIETKASIILLDFEKQLVWKSTDSSFLKMQYVLPRGCKILSSKLIQYDLDTGIYIIVDKKLPAWACPDIYITGLEYGVRKVVTRNSVIELKSYKKTKPKPPALEDVPAIFENISSSSITKIYRSYPPNRKKQIGKTKNNQAKFK